MTRTNRLPGGDDKHDYRTRQPHHRASPTQHAGANFNRKWPSMDTTDDIRQPPPVPKPRPPLRRSKVVSSRRKTTPERRHHPIRRFGAFTRDEEGTARGGDCEAAFKKGNDAGVPSALWPQRTAKGFPPIHPPRGSTIARSAHRANGEAPGASHARRRSAAHAARSGAPRICISHPPKGGRRAPPVAAATTPGATAQNIAHQAQHAAARHRPRHRCPPPRRHALGQRHAAAR